ncbi:MAG: transposon-encoded TnpW family protein [Oscillospiraceae bacterium]|nr:transposon-encoded TnpW family protein [Oscillospiraceae bacterium]
MNAIDKGAAVLPANGGGIPQMTTKVGKTTYDVFIHFSKTSKETLTDKVLRLIRTEVAAKD